MATPHGRVRDWAVTGETPVPGRTMPKLVVVERDYGAIAEMMAALGPLMDTLGTTGKGVSVDVRPEVVDGLHGEVAHRGQVSDVGGEAHRPFFCHTASCPYGPAIGPSEHRPTRCRRD